MERGKGSEKNKRTIQKTKKRNKSTNKNKKKNKKIKGHWDSRNDHFGRGAGSELQAEEKAKNVAKAKLKKENKYTNR